MILSPYTNPAFRKPTPKQSSPPRSPKRKRTESHAKSATTEHDEAFRGSSPRMQVADQLQELDIHQITPARLPANRKRPVQRKRLKRNPGLAELATVHASKATATPEYAKYDLKDPDEVDETPLCRSRPPDSLTETPSRPGEVIKISTEPSDEPRAVSVDRQSSETQGSPHSYRSLEAEAEPSERSLSPLPSREDLTPDQAALTWQEDEITGHEIDVSSGDDGEGINGVGFKPTLAMAYARQQRRKQQVNEWKAREAREARQKRFDRRRGAGHSEASLTAQDTDSNKARRIVRFAELQ